MAAASPSPEAAARVGLLYDERMCAHATPDGEDHPENPERLRAIWRKLNDEGVVSRCVVLKAKEAEDQHIASVHSQNHIKLIKEISSKKYDSRRNKIAKKFNSIYFNKGSSESALLAAGSVVVVAEKVAAGELSSAIALVRPPGHHAEHDKAMGFCLFNNVAIAANYLLNERTDLGIKKILIVDWDIHHGNATQKMFYDDPRVLSFSVHRFDYGTFYPYEADGSHNFIGEEAGRGYNINVPWEHGKCGDADYIAAWDHVLLPVTEAFDPDIILVSAGFDAALGDPLGGCCITPNGYALLLTKLLGFAKGRIVMALEGGYNLRSVASSVFACAKVLLGDKFTFNSPATQSSESTLRVIQAVRNELKTCWPVLSNNLSEIVSMTRPSPSEVHCPTLVGVPLGHTGPLLEETKVRCKRKRDNNTSLPATLKRSPACFNQCNPTDKRRSQRTMKAIHKQMVVDKDYANVSDSDGSHPNISEPEFSIQGEYLHDCSAAEVELDPLEETRETPFETSDPEHSLGAWSPPEDEDVIRTPVHVSRAFESSLQSFSVHDTQSSDLLRKTANSTEGSKAPNIINGSTLSSDFRGNLVPTFSATQRKDLKQHKNLKPQSSPIDNEHILGVEGRLNSLLDVDGGISKRKDAINGYLMLLLTAAAGGGARDLSLILEALLKTKSHSVLLDIINKNGLQMLHTILKQTRYIFHQTPILRRLLKVLEFLAQKGILTSEHINGGPRCAGVESFRDSMLSLTRHPDIQVHQIARSFRDRWIPHNNAKSEPTEYPHTSVNDLPEVAAWLEHEQIRRWASDGLQKISIALTQHLAQTDESLKRFAREKSELLRKNALGERDQAREEAIKQSEMADALNSRVGELVSELEAERKKNDLLRQLAAVEHQEMLDWRRRCEEAKKVRSEAVENAGILATALQSEEKAHAELRTAVADFSRRFGTEDLESRASARSQLSALGGYIRGELRGAFRSGVKCCMAVVCSHFLMTAETLDNLSDGFFFSSDDEGPGEDAKTAELYALVEEPAGKLAAHFEDEVCPPYSPIESSYEALMEPIEIFEETPTGTPMPGAGVGDETGDSAAPRTTSPDPGVGKADAPTPGAAGP